ncbi:hypothetical protein HPB50_001008 [Hyalomma asiaticum]|uniref:Uncharacterized protein n=1 Tax=Hyalomma asiaticum TaxID=266040 RepID=A0ACB7SLM4_HYAAI|nr:hypothetical protein HPB50_001008 [Hyalomma asiaticum]
MRLSHIQLLAVNASRELGRFVSVEVNGRTLRFKVDSGADVSVVPITFQGCPSSLDLPGGEQLLGPGRNRLDLIGLVSDAPVDGDHSQDGLTGQSATDNELHESIPVPGSPGTRYSCFGRRLKTPCRLRF